MSGAHWISARCPACGWANVLFVAEGGFVTCSRIECPNPEAAHTAIERGARPGVEVQSA